MSVATIIAGILVAALTFAVLVRVYHLFFQDKFEGDYWKSKIPNAVKKDKPDKSAPPADNATFSPGSMIVPKSPPRDDLM